MNEEMKKYSPKNIVSDSVPLKMISLVTSISFNGNLYIEKRLDNH